MILLLIYSVLLTASAFEVDDPCSAKLRILGESPIHIAAKPESSLEIFVHEGGLYSPVRAFCDVFLVTNLTDPDSYNLYQGPNCSAVVEEYQHDNRLFGYLKSVSSWRNHHLQPFNSTVVGVDTSLPYTISVKTWKINYIRLGVFVGGILLFLFSSSLVRNTLFYYSSGCGFGVLASLLLVAFIVWRVAPKKTIGIPIILGGWSVSLYMLHFAWNNLSSVLLQYQKFVAAYFITVLLVSFAVCYKKGPPTDARSHDIAQWTLQLIALIAIYFSTQVPEVSLAVMAVLVFHQLTKSWLWSTCFKISNILAYIWRKLFPVHPRLLSIEEYENQKKETTEKELSKLRSYCRSRDVDAWKLTNSVKNPKKLARFIDGAEDHISDEEHLIHEREGDLLERNSEEFLTEEPTTEEWEEEIIYRRTPKTKKGGLATSTSIRLSRGVSARLLAERLAASAGQTKPSSRLASKPHRHSIASSATGLPPRPESKTSTNSQKRKIKTSKQKSEYFSSDSERDYGSGSNRDISEFSDEGRM